MKRKTIEKKILISWKFKLISLNSIPEVDTVKAVTLEVALH